MDALVEHECKVLTDSVVAVDGPGPLGMTMASIIGHVGVRWKLVCFGWRLRHRRPTTVSTPASVSQLLCNSYCSDQLL